jgi:hypothetical protein
MSKAGIVAISCVELTKVVASDDVTGGTAVVIQLTTDPFTKFAPLTVRVTPGGLHAGVMFDEFVEDDKELMTGVAIVKGTREEVGVPGLTSTTFVVPGFTRSTAGTVAISSVGLPDDAAT